jgi:hypothetical protein
MSDTIIVQETSTVEYPKILKESVINKSDIVSYMWKLSGRENEELVIDFPNGDIDTIRIELYNGYRE